MLVIKDAMVLIHLAKTSLLGVSCEMFGTVVIPELVHKEVIKPEYPDTIIIKELIERKKIAVKAADKKYITKANQFNIYRGEAEAVALYWELGADYIATDDDNVRKKKEILGLKIIGTPSIVLKLYQERKIDAHKTHETIKRLKEMGWFSNTIWDKIQMETTKNE